ncbi:MAG: ABC transporter permease [Candidatus Gracilibacteria bacterium]|nr:ABC transporter permease [Candidatus Gracilibacteria bacterium]
MTDLLTLAGKEIKNFLKIWRQTLLPPVITVVLYILIFGKFIGDQVTVIEGVSYMDFIFPGLLMMSIIMGSYYLTSFGFFTAKMFKNIEELLVSPISNHKIILGYTIAGIARGVIAGILVFIVSLFFIELDIHNYFYIFLFILLTSTVFSLAGLLNGLYANNFDDVNIIPNFVITPLIYLGGVFYSINMLSPFWQELSKFNPILYMINGLRYAFIGVSDVNIGVSVVILVVFIVVLYSWILYLLKKGKGIRS